MTRRSLSASSPRRWAAYSAIIDSRGEQKQKRRAPISNFFGRYFKKSPTINVKGAIGLHLLYSPPDPIVDFIFVHGLDGGSRKTWSKTESDSHYWPKEWIRNEPAFAKKVRVYSFGYDSACGPMKKSTLTLFDFSLELLSSLSNCSSMRDTGDRTRIVLIGHSMGGLVIKEAYVNAKLKQQYKSLADRIHTMCFLGTPHDGSASAETLHNVLKVYGFPRRFVKQLKPGSNTLFKMNYQFSDFYDGLKIWSFYETEEYSLLGSLVVEKNSATLECGKHETVRPLIGDHRSICKFESQEDPNYKALCEAFEVTVLEISKIDDELSQNQMESLEAYLGVCVDPFATHLEGTCQWFLDKEPYRQWKEFAQDVPSILWVTGNLGSGKSTIARYIIEQLRAAGEDYSHYSVKEGELDMRPCFRSLALQMARRSPQVRGKLLEITQKSGTNLENENSDEIWQKLFESGIFRVELHKHYWVIDGLDECSDCDSFFHGLQRINQSIPLRILITSRYIPDLKRKFDSLSSDQHRHNISIEDTKDDIKRLIEFKMKHLPENKGNEASLMETLLEKSNGCFLWIDLVFEDLSNAHSEKEVSRILSKMPKGMEHKYRRILEIMLGATRENDTTNAILAWVTCAERPLEKDELKEALQLDIESGIHNLDDCVAARCGQLVAFDGSGKLRMIHEAAREFLVNEDLDSEFAVRETVAHTRIAKACLRYLTKDEMKPPRYPGEERARSKFLKYAAMKFSCHLAKADPLDGDIFRLLDIFLSSNVLSWIEFIAKDQVLTPLIDTATTLAVYTDARSKLEAELDTAIEKKIRGWTSDLDHIAKRFSEDLIRSPSAIYAQIPQFCPEDTFIRKATVSEHEFSVFGWPAVEWDYQLVSTDVEGGITALCYGEKFFAIASATETDIEIVTAYITVYHTSLFEIYKTLTNDEEIKFLQFKPGANDILVCYGTKRIKIYDVVNDKEVTILRQLNNDEEILYIMDYLIDGESLIVAVESKTRHLKTWSWDLRGIPYQHAKEGLAGRREWPLRASFSKVSRLLAVSYHDPQVIEIWDLDRRYIRDIPLLDKPSITDIVFGPRELFGPSETIAVLFKNNEVLVIDIDGSNTKKIDKREGPVESLATSPDRQRLAVVGDSSIEIYDFHTSKLLHHVEYSPGSFVRADVDAEQTLRRVAFSEDGYSLAVLEDGAVKFRRLPPPDQQTTGGGRQLGPSRPGERAKTLAVDREGKYAYYAKSFGRVYQHTLGTNDSCKLYQHKDRSSVYIICVWPEYHSIISVSTSETGPDELLVWRLDERRTLSKDNVPEYIYQILPCANEQKFIISARDSNWLWDINAQGGTYIEMPENWVAGRWIQHPQSLQHLIYVIEDSACIYTWGDFINRVMLKSREEITQFFGAIAKLERPAFSFTLDNDRAHIVIPVRLLDGSDCWQRLYPYSFDLVRSFDGTLSKITCVEENPWLRVILLSPVLQNHILSIYGVSSTNHLVFQGKNRWLCSMDLASLRTRPLSYKRHFLIPHEVKTTCMLISQEDIIISYYPGIVRIKGGLLYGEKVKVEF
ncbi:uncharacterized protein GIQ15_04427 [Arthroderma uncinatum]|uniref:uncharacterized protein n=1 Tax=Arthroderma uncinatum TaxID=74035 RepID=UPI00144AA099|nr:uncharacterized protein GIQ15_04427 [Arthroderma uncinatum]KAF3481668.1 hypothetical protein GIQ15_04427 [Arthroderma uncinatum]